MDTNTRQDGASGTDAAATPGFVSFDGLGGVTGVGAAAAGRGLMMARPTASECAQMIPRTRESRHEQRFSTSMAFRNFSPARKDLPPSVSLPLSKGGS